MSNSFNWNKSYYHYVSTNQRHPRKFDIGDRVVYKNKQWRISGIAGTGYYRHLYYSLKCKGNNEVARSDKIEHIY